MSLTLESQRLILKPVSANQLSVLHSILTNPDVRRYLCDDKVLSLAAVKAMISQSEMLFARERLGFWLIEPKTLPEIIGFVGLWYFFDEEQPQLIYALLPKMTRQGYATEAAARILTYCFSELGYRYLIASCDQSNLASQQVAIRLGMTKTEERTVDANPIVFFRVERPT